MNRKLTHWTWISLFTICLGFFFGGCEGRGGQSPDSNPGTPVAIFGDATLQVQVQDYKSNIYLDDEFIGSVEAGSSEQWAIPSGQHTLKVTNAAANYEPQEQTFTITKGETYSVPVSWVQAPVS
jgi:hypothetical protein